MSSSQPSPASTLNRASGVVLMGGKSTRMGRDKATLERDGEPFWKHQARVLREAGIECVFLAIGSRDSSEFIEPGIEPVRDAYPDSGPLAGIEAAMARLRTPWLVVLAVDLPCIDAVFIRWLVETASVEGKGIVPETESGIEPLAAIYPADCAGLLREFLENGELAARAFATEAQAAGYVSARRIDASLAAALRNVNTPGDLATLDSQE